MWVVGMLAHFFVVMLMAIRAALIEHWTLAACVERNAFDGVAGEVFCCFPSFVTNRNAVSGETTVWCNFQVAPLLVFGFRHIGGVDVRIDVIGDE